VNSSKLEGVGRMLTRNRKYQGLGIFRMKIGWRGTLIKHGAKGHCKDTFANRMLVARMTMDTSRMRLGQYQDDTKDTAQGTSDV